MANKALRPCAKPGCRNLTRDTYCEEHARQKVIDKREYQKRYDKFERDKDRTKFYNSVAWRRAKRMRLEIDHYLCQKCLTEKCNVVPADVVHHIKPLQKCPEMGLVIDNLISLCHDCHNKIHGRG